MIRRCVIRIKQKTLLSNALQVCSDIKKNKIQNKPDFRQ